jgi:DNA-binding transcriptional LysR family regulator
MVADDIASGALKQIRIAALDPRQMYIPMSAAYRRDSPPGPAARWLIDRLRQCSDHAEHAIKSAVRKKRASNK